MNKTYSLVDFSFKQLESLMPSLCLSVLHHYNEHSKPEHNGVVTGLLVMIVTDSKVPCKY